MSGFSATPQLWDDTKSYNKGRVLPISGPALKLEEKPFFECETEAFCDCACPVDPCTCCLRIRKRIRGPINVQHYTTSAIFSYLCGKDNRKAAQ
jgi:hypothetical protein